MVDSIFGLQESALMVRSQRAEMIANNLANADTPGFKAQDLDFRAALSQASATGNAHAFSDPLARSHRQHLQGFESAELSPLVKYRLNLQPSLDGNTVDTQVEKSQYMKNALYMQATLRFLGDRISGIRSALKGE